MKIKHYLGFTLLMVTFATSVFGQTKIHDNLIVPPNNQKFEVEIHGAAWSVTPIARIFDEKLDEIFSDEILYSLNFALRSSPISIDPSEIDYTRDFNYSSVGYYYGAAVRYYPKGGASRFVFGLSVDKTYVEVRGSTDFTQNVIPSLKANGTGMIRMQPIVANLHFQYHFTEIKKITPYMTFGLGAGLLNKTNEKVNSFQFDLNTSFRLFGVETSFPANFTYSFEEIEDRSGGRTNIPQVMPLVNLAFGAKAYVSNVANINLEVGIYNGLAAKLGAAMRF